MESLEGRAPVGGAERFWLSLESCIEFTSENLDCSMGNSPPATFTARPSNFAQLTGVSIARDHARGPGTCIAGQTQAGPFTKMCATFNAARGIKSDGTIACWGWDPNSQGIFQVPNLLFSSIKTGWATSCGVTTTGKAACWGNIRRTPLD